MVNRILVDGAPKGMVLAVGQSRSQYGMVMALDSNSGAVKWINPMTTTQYYLYADAQVFRGQVFACGTLMFNTTMTLQRAVNGDALITRHNLTEGKRDETLTLVWGTTMLDSC